MKNNCISDVRKAKLDIVRMMRTDAKRYAANTNAADFPQAGTCRYVVKAKDGVVSWSYYDANTSHICRCEVDAEYWLKRYNDIFRYLNKENIHIFFQEMEENCGSHEYAEIGSSGWEDISCEFWSKEGFSALYGISKENAEEITRRIEIGLNSELRETLKNCVCEGAFNG